MDRKAFVVISLVISLIIALLPQAAMAEKRVLNILTWAGYNENRIIEPFEKKYNCKVDGLVKSQKSFT